MKGDEVTMARYLARKATLAEWKRQGIRLQAMDRADIDRAANAFLDGNRAELVALACAALNTIAQKRKARKQGTSTVQMS